MKQFVKKFLFLTLLLLGILFMIICFDYGVIGSQYKFSYNASLIDKLNRLNSIDNSKIVLVGNSNLAFGIDSHAIEETFNMPVVNLGLHAGLGNAFHEEIAKQNINHGDIVIICHSDYSDSDTISDPELALLTYDNNSIIFPIFRAKDYADILTAYPSYLRKAYWLWITKQGNQVPDSSYSREAFNEYGDVIYKPEKDQIKEEYFRNHTSALPKISDICVSRINEFNEYCLERGATLLVAGYPIERGKYSTYLDEEYIDFQDELTNLLECPVISDYTDYFYPYEYFYNDCLHLNETGRQVRTKQLIMDLSNWINSSDK